MGTTQPEIDNVPKENFPINANNGYSIWIQPLKRIHENDISATWIHVIGATIDWIYLFILQYVIDSIASN